MSRRALTKSHRGAVATATGATAAGVTAAGAASLGAMTIGAVALGAVALGALAIGRLRVGRASLRRVEIGELAVGRLAVGGVAVPGGLTGVARLRAAPGMGDALERLLRDRTADSGPEASLFRAHRSRNEPDLFLLHESSASETAEAPRWLEDLLRQTAELGLVADPADAPVEVERFRAI